MPPPAATGAPERRRGRSPRPPLPRGFGTIWTTVALDLVGFGIVLPVLPLYARRYHASAFTAGALVAAFSLAQLLASPVWGRVSDRIGRKPVLIVSLAGTAVGSLLTGLAGGLPLLFIGRLVDGASGASVSVAQASAADLAPPDQRARLFGLLGAAFGIGFVLGPAIGGALAPIDPRLPFFAAAAVAGLNAVVAVRRLPETRPAAPPIEAVAPARRAAWRAPGVVSLIAVSFLSLIAFSAFEGTFALFGQRRLDLHESSTYVVFFIIGVLIAVVEVGLVHPAVSRFGERGALQIGLVLNAAGLAILPAVHSRWWLAPSLILLTAGQGLVTPTLSSTVAGQVGHRDRGTVLGVQQSAGGLARVIGPAIGGLVFGHLGVGLPYAGGAVLVAAAAVGLALSPRPEPVAGEPTPDDDAPRERPIA
jgi:MFS transporter, DHA1 family, tetracycline resistance protein